ncbi:MAG: thioesterase [Chloroflexi bacterium]|nr:MAG: thioesterase [Chloroflexota bacterium]MBL1192822.1 thioesterase [Chloroflexota bacterium]NOH10115.1 thioesterase family protein [Chloroflexota bacterium]
MDLDNSIKPGLKSEQNFTVLEEHSAAHIGSGTVSVLSTPSMIGFMEITARSMLDEVLPDTHSTVGVRVDVRHLAASPIGSEVKTCAEVLNVHGNRVTLSIEAWYGDTQIGAGQHDRFIIEKERFMRRVAG